jgi:uncharacterized protein YktB (UPF0637 family)
MDLFTASDFKIFDIPGFRDRMGAIAKNVRPKLVAIGEELAPKVSEMVDRTIFPHVALHARRTVNPPDDTWMAMGSSKRGYKQDVHFKVAISRNCVRLLFEVGPEYYQKGEWALEWKREHDLVRESIEGNRKLSWFKNEHDEEPQIGLNKLSTDALRDLGVELTRRREGQLVLGRKISEKEFLGMSSASFKRAANASFKPLSPLFSLRAPRVLVAS